MVLKSLNTDTVIGNWREIVKLTIVREKFSISQKLPVWWGELKFFGSWGGTFLARNKTFGIFLGETDPG